MKRTSAATSYTLAAAALKNLVREYTAPICGKHGDHDHLIDRDGPWLTLEYRRSFGAVIELTTDLRLVKCGAAHKTYEVRVEVNWPGHSRDVMTAQAAVDLYQQVVTAARAIQIGMDELGTIVEDQVDEEVMVDAKKEN